MDGQVFVCLCLCLSVFYLEIMCSVPVFRQKSTTFAKWIIMCYQQCTKECTIQLQGEHKCFFTLVLLCLFGKSIVSLARFPFCPVCSFVFQFWVLNAQSGMDFLLDFKIFYTSRVKRWPTFPYVFLREKDDLLHVPMHLILLYPIRLWMKLTHLGNKNSFYFMLKLVVFSEK